MTRAEVAAARWDGPWLGLGAELREAGGQLRSAAADSFGGLGHAFRSDWKSTVLVIWGVATLLDAVTTTSLLHRAGFAEGNPLAHLLMGSVGVSGYVAAASVLSMLIAVFATATVRGVYANVVVHVAVAAGVVKLGVATHNLLLVLYT